VPAAPPRPSVRADVWTWAVRMYPSRSAASTACKAGHVKIDGASAKPASPVKVGDKVRVLTKGGERILVVTKLIEKRTSAPLAAECYDDLTPPPPPKEERVVVAVRERGAGRPTKRERRETERLRGRS
jgi:ribosome-associated heat shock protein Hsp15